MFKERYKYFLILYMRVKTNIYPNNYLNCVFGNVLQNIKTYLYFFYKPIAVPPFQLNPP